MKIKHLCSKSHTFLLVIDQDIITSRKKPSSIPNIMEYTRLFYNKEKLDTAVPI